MKNVQIAYRKTLNLTKLKINSKQNTQKLLLVLTGNYMYSISSFCLDEFVNG